MKKILCASLTLFLLLSLSGCSLEKAVTVLGKTQLTKNRNLTGERILGNDTYTGSYTSEADNRNGREVIFGGASTKEKALLLSGTIETESGEAHIRIRQNETVVFPTVKEDGTFRTELLFSSGGNYIMIEYHNFTGTITLTSQPNQKGADHS